MKTTGTNTMQMQSVATKAGVAICWAPSRIALITGFPIARFRFVFSISTVASSTRMPTASARPPSVITFRVSPKSESVITETRMASGIDTTITSVERREPAVDVDHVRLHGEPVAHVCDVSHVHRGAADLLHREVVQRLEDVGRGVGADVVLDGSDLRGAGRKDDVLAREGVRDVEGRE